MEAITKELTIDLYGPTLRYAVEAHQGDRRTRYLLITVTENGDPYTLPTSADYIAQIKRPDNVHVYIPCAVENNLIKVELKGDALKKAGRAVCEIVINESTEEQTLTTQSFEIEIAPMAGAANSIEASDDLPSMEEQIKKNTEAISSLSEEIENIPSGGSGLTTAEKTAMLTLFKAAAYTSNVSATIADLETLWSGGTVEPDEPVVPDIPDADVMQTGSVLSIVNGVTVNQSGSVLAIA